MFFFYKVKVFDLLIELLLNCLFNYFFDGNQIHIKFEFIYQLNESLLEMQKKKKLNLIFIFFLSALQTKENLSRS